MPLQSKTIIQLIIGLKLACQQREDQIMRQSDISQAQYHCLALMEPEERLSGHQLADRLGLSVSRASRLIDQLVSRGLLERSPHSRDRRAIEVSLTSAGLDIKAGIDRSMEECEQKLRQKLSPADITALQNCLEAMATL